MKIYLKSFTLIILLLFLSGFNKIDYKLEKIINDGSEFKVIIPRNFCLFTSKAQEKFINENISKNLNYYFYINCLDLEKIKSNKTVEIDEVFTISISKKNNFLFIENKIPIKNLKIDKDTEFKEKLSKINLDEFAKKENISNSEKIFLQDAIDRSINLFSDKTIFDYKITNNNVFNSVEFKSKDDNIFSSIYLGYIKGFLFNIEYESKNKKNELNDLNNFSKYIEEIISLNKGKKNNYYIFKNQILNIVSPNENFYDISDIKFFDKFNNKKIFVELFNDVKKPKTLMAVAIIPKSLNSNFDFINYFEKIHNEIKSNITKGKDGNYDYIRIENNKNVYYIYFAKIKNYDLFVYSFMHYKPTNFNIIKSDNYLQKNIKKYIKKLEKVNE